MNGFAAKLFKWHFYRNHIFDNLLGYTHSRPDLAHILYVSISLTC
jgi:hypothetical protein